MKPILAVSLVVAMLIPSLAQGFGRPTTTTAEAAAANAAPTAPSVGNDARRRFAAGLLSEEGESDLAAAAAAYRQTIQAFDRQRAEAANAIFRLGEVYRKMGALEEAKVQYARILREFPDMLRLTELSHDLLFGEEPKPAGAAGGGFGGGSGGGGSGGFGGGGGMPGTQSQSAEPGTEAAPGGGGLADPAYYERLMMQRYGIVPGRMPAATQQPGSGFLSEGARDQASRIQCINHLKQLALAARIYATDHEGAFPSTVGVMSHEISVTKVLVCPSDSSHQPAESWDAFDPTLHLTYEFPGASGREDEPQRVLFRCPIHGHIALGDGSVHPGPSASTTVTPQVDDILRRRYGLVGAGQSAESPTVTVSQPVAITVAVLRDGSLTLNGGPMDLAGVTQLIQQMPDAMRATTMLELQADPEAEFSRIVAVLEAGQEAGLARIKLGAEPRAAMAREIERLKGDYRSLGTALSSIQEEAATLNRYMDPFKPAIDQARAQQTLAQERLEALSFPADRLPAVVGQDARYQRLKGTYETAVLDGDKAAQERARARLQEWVEAIYRPELESEAELADRRLAASLAEEQDHRMKQQSLQAQQRELQDKLTAAQERMNQLITLLNQSP